jgi:hypothetical protein
MDSTPKTSTNSPGSTLTLNRPHIKVASQSPVILELLANDGVEHGTVATNSFRSISHARQGV